MFTKSIDFVFKLIKWPVALFLLVSIPALLRSYDYFNINSIKVWAFAGGAVLYFAIMIFAGQNISRTMQIISHELTHLMFAYLTFHDAGRVRINPDDSGGEMIVKGGGNWLITLAPYFFPLFSFLYMLLMPWLVIASGEHFMVYAIFGYFFGYYWGTVLSQVHPEQTDIIREGYIFSAIFIVGANLYTTGIILAFNSKLWDGVKEYLNLVWRLDIHYWLKAAKLILQYFE
ncbi:MAG: M50 family metallopeptidase [Alphaproteobacteria bacterium]|nr:M50 family metallopeptidase [Alphaproteobacteria bacterium]